MHQNLQYLGILWIFAPWRHPVQVYALEEIVRVLLRSSHSLFIGTDFNFLTTSSLFRQIARIPDHDSCKDRKRLFSVSVWHQSFSHTDNLQVCLESGFLLTVTLTNSATAGWAVKFTTHLRDAETPNCDVLNTQHPTHKVKPTWMLISVYVKENIQNMRLLRGISRGSNPSISVCSLSYLIVHK